MFRDVTPLLQTGGYLVKRFINWKEKENATNRTRRQLRACGRWSHGKWEETGEAKPRSPQSLWGCSRPAQEAVPEPAGSLIMAAAPGGRGEDLRVRPLRQQGGSSRWESSPLGCGGGGPRLPESLLPNRLARHLWKEARASADLGPERKPSPQAVFLSHRLLRVLSLQLFSSIMRGLSLNG